MVVLLIAISEVYSTYNGYTKWYFRVNGSVTIDGRQTTGYLHADTQKTVLLLTRTDEPRKETYLVPLQGSTKIIDCGDWNPLRFLPTAIGDMSPGCSFFTDPARVADAPIDSSLMLRRRSVEFRTASGKKVKAEW